MGRQERGGSRLRLPLQVVETVNAPRSDRGTLFEGVSTPDVDDWRNRLVWGDNLHVLESLADELAGQVDLVYIDPPFDSRQDYKVRINVGDGTAGADQELSRIASVIEEKAYRDTWGKGVESCLQMLYERLVLIRELLSDRGSLFLHLAPNVDPVDVLRPAVAVGARQVVLAHNQLEDVGISASDRAVTRRLVAAGAVLGVRLRAHLVLTPERWFDALDPDEVERSYTDRGVAPFAKRATLR